MDMWVEIKDGNPVGYYLARQHYSAKKNKRPKIKLFVGPGEKLVLMTCLSDALFVWRRFIDDSGQTGINCALFRNLSETLSSDLILAAEQYAHKKWPGERLYTYIDSAEIKSTNPGYCFLMAGWQRMAQKTKGGLYILEKLPSMNNGGT